MEQGYPQFIRTKTEKGWVFGLEANFLLYHYPNVVRQMANIATMSNMVLRFCGIYSTCQSYVFFFIDKNHFNIDPELNTLDNYRISAFLVAIRVNGQIEIHDIYLYYNEYYPSYEINDRYDVMLKIIFNQAQQDGKDVVIFFDPSSKEEFLKGVMTWGFDEIYQGRVLPGGAPIPPGFLVLVRRANVQQRIGTEKRIAKLEKFVRARSELADSCGLLIIIGRNVSLYLRNLVGNYDKEIAGNFIYRLEPSAFGAQYVLGLKPLALVAGTGNDVAIERRVFTFHTHPLEAYKQAGVYVGWPSGSDFTIFLEDGFETLTNPVYVEFVVALEGLYMAMLNLDFRRYLINISQDEPAKALLKEVIFQGFAQLERERSLSIEESKRLPTFINFLQLVGNMTFGWLRDKIKEYCGITGKLECTETLRKLTLEIVGLDTNTRLFDFLFQRWEEIQNYPMTISKVGILCANRTTAVPAPSHPNAYDPDILY